MTAAVRQTAARELGGGYWRVDLALVPDPESVVPPPRPHPRTATVSATGVTVPGARIESLTVPSPSSRDRFSVVLAVQGALRPGVPARFRLSGEGWSGYVLLTPPEAPAPLPSGPAPPVPAAIDYTARDFDALRTMLLGIIDSQFGAGLSDHPVSQTAALVELIAYLGDALSYRQDAVATEAYLASARRRISAYNHAALLDYYAFQGQTARAWLRLKVSEPLTLPAGTQVAARVNGPPPVLSASGPVTGAIVFETREAVDLVPGDDVHLLSTEDDPGGRIIVGATSATLAGNGEGLSAGVLATIGPIADPSGAGQVVRLTGVRRDGETTVVEWGVHDAFADDWSVSRGPLGLRGGNLVLADQGITHDWTPLSPPQAGQRYRPTLPYPNPAFPPPSIAADATTSAAEMLTGGAPSLVGALAAVCVREGEGARSRPWTQRPSLLESGPLDPTYVVEVDNDGVSRLRFGDGVNGMQPQLESSFSAWMRSGGGAAGNVGVGAITHMLSSDLRIIAVTNPMAAGGGGDPEPLDSVRTNAPRAFRITDRAVAAAEYTAVALAVTDVADATTVLESSGSGPLAQVRVHAATWTSPVTTLVAQVRAALEQLRPVGVALDVRGAIPMPVTIELDVRVTNGWTLAATADALDAVLETGVLAQGRFGFDTVLYRSDLVRLVAPVTGVADVIVSRFEWTGGGPSAGPHDELVPPFGHVIRIDNDVTAPGNGSISFSLRAAA